MKKAISFALVLAMLVSVFAISFATTVNAAEKEFVIDGNLDVWYLSNEETLVDDLNYYHFDTLEAYNLDPTNGHGIYFFDGAQTAAEVYMAYDDTYVYVYVKCWDDDIAINPEDTSGSSSSDSLEIWFDPDPNSQTTNPDGTPKNPDEIGDWPTNTCDPLQGDARLRMRAADFKVSDIHPCVKPNYNGVVTTDYFNSPENLMPFYFSNEPREVPTGDIVSSGFGVEVRFPRYDGTGGNAFRVNVACNNRLEGDESEWYALAMGEAWWLNYATANQVIYPKSGNPFFDQDPETLATKSVYYTESAYNAEGMRVAGLISELPANVTSLEKAKVQTAVDEYLALNDFQKGYVQARNLATLKAAADTLGIALEEDVPSQPDVSEPDTTPTDALDLGDVNGDQAINAKDALLVLRIAVNKYDANDAEKVAADANEDDSINAKDALEILKFAVGKPSCLAK